MCEEVHSGYLFCATQDYQSDTATFTCGKEGSMRPPPFEQIFEGPLYKATAALKDVLKTGKLEDIGKLSEAPVCALPVTHLPKKESFLGYKCTYEAQGKEPLEPPTSKQCSATVMVSAAP
ncbi:hypothetical protein BESB_034300 [Besnoitia besnoiti]|uniref:SRS domain-containing protein n=1 Tax=Besnoitia besnoiti TaxID=94643 RepID=A0A2A9MN01_BESBE|nr:hypothetical protein BESB_034300 [Besnoitia besnoiti]PFH36972.1 hypothetical protein BESB_034300 [Besnoitia besnoiti]